MTTATTLRKYQDIIEGKLPPGLQAHIDAKSESKEEEVEESTEEEVEESRHFSLSQVNNAHILRKYQDILNEKWDDKQDYVDIRTPDERSRAKVNPLSNDSVEAEYKRLGLDGAWYEDDPLSGGSDTKGMSDLDIRIARQKAIDQEYAKIDARDAKNAEDKALGKLQTQTDIEQDNRLTAKRDEVADDQAAGKAEKLRQRLALYRAQGNDFTGTRPDNRINTIAGMDPKSSGYKGNILGSINDEDEAALAADAAANQAAGKTSSQAPHGPPHTQGSKPPTQGSKQSVRSTRYVRSSPPHETHSNLPDSGRHREVFDWPKQRGHGHADDVIPKTADPVTGPGAEVYHNEPTHRARPRPTKHLSPTSVEPPIALPKAPPKPPKQKARYNISTGSYSQT